MAFRELQDFCVTRWPLSGGWIPRFAGVLADDDNYARLKSNHLPLICSLQSLGPATCRISSHAFCAT